MAAPEPQAVECTVFIVSDRTGVTAETLAHTLLSQFDKVEFERVVCPYVDTVAKVQALVQRIDSTAERSGVPPLVVSTLVDDGLRATLETGRGLVMDLFEAFIAPMEGSLGMRSAHAVGRSHGVHAAQSYKSRIDAVNYSLTTDDGVATRNYVDADVVIIGVSRSGKTPTSLYLALQFGILAANYPLTEEDLESGHLPKVLEPWRSKLFGLTIDPVRLQQIRAERRADSHYGSLEQCRKEVAAAEALYRRERIPFMDTSAVSIEEIATSIIHEAGLARRHYS